MCFHHDGRTVTGDSNGDILLWSLPAPTYSVLMLLASAHVGGVSTMAATPFGFLSGGMRDNRVRLWTWDLKTFPVEGTEVNMIDAGAPVRALATVPTAEGPSLSQFVVSRRGFEGDFRGLPTNPFISFSPLRWAWPLTRSLLWMPARARRASLLMDMTRCEGEKACVALFPQLRTSKIVRACPQFAAMVPDPQDSNRLLTVTTHGLIRCWDLQTHMAIWRTFLDDKVRLVDDWLECALPLNVARTQGWPTNMHDDGGWPT